MPNRSVPGESVSGLLRPADAAALLGVSRRTLLRLEQAGLVHPTRLPSGHRRYRRDDLEQALQESA